MASNLLKTSLIDKYPMIQRAR